MRIVAGFICAFVLFMGAPCHAADDTPSTVKGKSAAKKKSAAKEKSPVKAKETYSISLTPTVGEYFFASKDKLKDSQIYAVKLSYNIIGSQMLDSLGIDAIAGYIDTTSTIDNSKAKVYHLRLDATYPFIFKNSNFTPFLAVGAGGNLYERSDATNGKALFGFGGGLKYKLLDYLAVRADVRQIILFTPERDNNVEITTGLTYTFGVERKPKPPADSDNDGVPDTLDKCPGTPKGVKVDKNGCSESQAAVLKAAAPSEGAEAVKKGEPAAPSVTTQAPAPPAPAAAPAEAAPAPAATREVSPESKI